MQDNRQGPTPEELHRELREARQEQQAEAQAELAEESQEIATEAEVRSGIRTEEADMWGGVNTGDDAIKELETLKAKLKALEPSTLSANELEQLQQDTAKLCAEVRAQCATEFQTLKRH